MHDEEQLFEVINKHLHDYNAQQGVRKMNLVLFSDAVDHVSRFCRIMSQSQGNGLIVGVGGSGRTSLIRLAAFIAKFEVFLLETSTRRGQTFGINEFHEKIKDLFRECGVNGKKTVFVIKDTQFVNRQMLEDLNSLLSSGEIPNIYDPEELEDICNQVRENAFSAAGGQMKDDSDDYLFSYFLSQIKKNLRVFVCVNPLSPAFRSTIRGFPALVNSTSIDWLDEWPQCALEEVARSKISALDFCNIRLKEMTVKQKQMQQIQRQREAEERQDEEGSGPVEEEKEKSVDELLSEMCVCIHRCAIEGSEKMLAELKKRNDVTPANYLDLVIGFVELMAQQKSLLSRSCEKLEKGVSTLHNASESVNAMRVDLAKRKEEVALADAVCENLMEKIMKEQADLNLKREEVSKQRFRIEQRTTKMEAVENEAKRELERVQPELDKAVEAVNGIQANDIGELRNYTNPPPNVEMTLVAVMAVLNKKTTYDEAKSHMSNPRKFIKLISSFDHENMSPKLIGRIKKHIDQKKFDPEIVGKSSRAAADLCMWVIASENYGRVFNFVRPKRLKLKEARETLNAEQAKLREAEARLCALDENLKQLEEHLQKKKAEKVELNKQKQMTEKRLGLAAQLVGGLADERERWTKKIADLKVQLQNVAGDSFLASAFLSYCGPFTAEYREEFLRKWITELEDRRIPFSPDFNVKQFLINTKEIQSWVLQQLPTDDFSGENACLVTRGKRWSLMVDPQGQATRWIKNLEPNLLVTNLEKCDFLLEVKNCVMYGRPLLIEDVLEEVDPALRNILLKETYKIGRRTVVKFCDEEIDFNPDFRLYITTKLSNPQFDTSLCIMANIVNFSVTKSGLENQLLGTVVNKENPELESQKRDIVNSLADGKQKMVELEDSILQQITDSGDDLLDEGIITVLQQSKKTSEKVKQQIKRNRRTEKKIDQMREAYRKSAVRASILYFVLCDLSLIDPMYQFSLDKYVDLFEESIQISEKPSRRRAHDSENISKRVEMLNEFHTYAVYKSTCRGLFEKDKLLFSFHLCAQIELEQQRLNPDEYSFFLRGALGLDREVQMGNPCAEWLPDEAWDNLCELNKLFNFHEIVNSVEEYPSQWYDWYHSDDPSTEKLPSEWQSKCGFWERLILIRCCRLDKLLPSIREFIVKRMSVSAGGVGKKRDSAHGGRGVDLMNQVGEMYVNPPTTKMKDVYDGSTPAVPFIFVLSPAQGVDPLPKIRKLAKNVGVKLNPMALGLNQERRATTILEEGIQSGEWVFLANCHLLMGWLPILERIIKDIPNRQPNESFRLWLSSKPHKKFSINILQNSHRITLEPSTGIKCNMQRLLADISPDLFVKDSLELKKCIYSLLFYHSILLERKKFGTLGWNTPAAFNDGDFGISMDILRLNVGTYGPVLEKPSTNWSAIRFLIGEINYGGRVTDENDRRVLDVYTRTAFNRKVVLKNKTYQLTHPDHEPQHGSRPGTAASTASGRDLYAYVVPPPGSLGTYEGLSKYIDQDLPNVGAASAFGQHPNAVVASLIRASKTLLAEMAEMTVQQSAQRMVQGGKPSSPEQLVVLRATSMLGLKAGIPAEVSVEMLENDTSPLNVVLLHEAANYNILLKTIRGDLVDLLKATKGDIVMSDRLENIFVDISQGRVPRSWKRDSFPSVKTLAAWVRDLRKRVDQIRGWVDAGRPPVTFWLAGFIYPTCLLTALKQQTARSRNVSIDQVQFEYVIMGREKIMQRPKEGAYIHGMLLEGANWSFDSNHLSEPNTMSLLVEMPIIWFRPTVAGSLRKRKKSEKDLTGQHHGKYKCPVYYYPRRARKSYVTSVDLKMGPHQSKDHWVKRGTALLLCD